MVTDTLAQLRGLLPKEMVAALEASSTGATPASSDSVIWTSDKSEAEIKGVVDAALAAGNFVTVYLDPGADTNFVFQLALPWNTDRVDFVGVAPLWFGSNLQLMQGFDFVNKPRMRCSNIFLTSGDSDAGTGPVMIAKGPLDWLLIDSFFVVIWGSLTLSDTTNVLMLNNAIIPDDTKFFLLADGAACFAPILASSLRGDCFDLASGATAANLNVSADSASIVVNVSTTPGLTTTITPYADPSAGGNGAALTSYVPTGTSFADPVPASVSKAIDRMAALLKTLNSGTPIP